MLIAVMPITAGTERVVLSYGTVGDGGAEWTLYLDGTLEVQEGFIDTAGGTPWHGYRSYIQRIIFTGPITAGDSLRGLFQDLINVYRIDGLDYFDTSNVTNMALMFNMARNLTDLDLSNWDVSNVTYMSNMFSTMWRLRNLNTTGWDVSNVTSMSQMFTGASVLASLDLSDWNTQSVQTMSSMFFVMGGLRQLSLGENFRFDDTRGQSPELPSVSTTAPYSGRWANVGNGTVDNPQAEFLLTSSQLVTHHNTYPSREIWVWYRSDGGGGNGNNGSIHENYVVEINIRRLSNATDGNLRLIATRSDENGVLSNAEVLDNFNAPISVAGGELRVTKTLPEWFDENSQVLLWQADTMTPIVLPVPHPGD